MTWTVRPWFRTTCVGTINSIRWQLYCLTVFDFTGEVQEALSARLNFDANFVRYMLDMVYAVCRDLNQLSYFVRSISFL